MPPYLLAMCIGTGLHDSMATDQKKREEDMTVEQVILGECSNNWSGKLKRDQIEYKLWNFPQTIKGLLQKEFKE